MIPFHIYIRRFGGWLVVGFTCLVLCGCATFVTSEEWHCVDEKGEPLPGVIALYAYGGTGWGAGYSHEGGAVVSDSNGVLRYPAKPVFHTAIFDSAPIRRVFFLYSEQMHASSNNMIGMETSLRIDDKTNTYIFRNESGNPTQWYLSLKSLLSKSYLLLADEGSRDVNYIATTASNLQPMADRELERFVSKYGKTQPDANNRYILDDIREYASNHVMNPNNVTFLMLLSTNKP